MKSIEKKRSSKRKILIALILLFLTMTAGYFTWRATNANDKETGVSGTTSENSSPFDEGSSADVVKPGADANPAGPTKPSTTTIPAATAAGASISIRQAKQSTDTIVVEGVVSNVAAGGQCIVYFTSQNGDVTSYYLDQKMDGESIICSKSWPETSFNSLGTSQVRVVYITTEQTSVESTTSMEIR